MKYLPFVLIVAVLGLADQAHSQGPTLDDIRSTLGELAQRELDKGVASISIALVRDGEVVMTEAWGWSNVWTKTPATPETIYCTGSTFKAVTATALLQLAEQGKLSLDDAANDHLGEHPIKGDTENRITIRHLLNHTSGITPGASTNDIFSRVLPTPLKDIPGMVGIVTEPGEAWVYNNHAYAIAGLIIEQVSGQTYERYILEHVLKPLGVTTPGPVHPTPDMLQRLAMPYTTGANAQPVPAPFVHFDVYPAGDIYLTAEDMARFLASHLNEGTFGEACILSAESIAEAHTPGMNNYALGWGVLQQDGHTTISHGGGVQGFLTYMVGDVSTGSGAYVMSNSGNMAPIANAAITMLNGDDYAPPAVRAEVELPAEVLAEYVGEYDLAGGVFTIYLNDGQLSAQLTGQQRLPIFAEAKDKLFYKVVDAQLTVLRDENGAVRGMMLHQGGQEIEAPRRGGT